MSFRVRDPIHNFVALPDDLVPVLDSEVLQRLRGIRQLALATLVYPGALHTRFDHTVGVTHVARLMADQLRFSEDERRLVTLAALLHDAGHGPFSHVSEASLDRFGDKSTLKDDQKEHKIHEVVTAEIIRTDPELSKILNGEERERIVRLLGNWDGRPALKQVVSGPLDADKQDYLLRDGYFCGVQYGRFDIAQLHRTLVLPDPESEVMIEGDVHAVEQFVLAKYYMTANVYRHKVRLVTDQMITRAIRLGIEVDKLSALERLYRFDGSKDFIQHYQTWDDARFLEAFCPLGSPSPGAKSGRMLRMLRSRSLLKEVFRDQIGKPYDARSYEAMRGLPGRKFQPFAKGVEQRVAEYLTRKLGLRVGVDSDFVIAHSFSLKSVRESSRNDEEGILVNEKPAPQPFTDVSTLFRSINEGIAEHQVVIFAPILWPKPEEKDDFRASWKDDIRTIIQEEWKAQGRP